MAACTCCSTAAPIAAPRWSTTATATRRASPAAITAGASIPTGAWPAFPCRTAAPPISTNRPSASPARPEGDRRGATVVEAEMKQTAASWKDRKSYIAGNGRGWTSNTALDEGKRSSPAYDEYKRVLAESVGAERAQQILTPRLHNSLIYPNVSIMGLNIHVRVIKPVAVDRTEVTIYPIRLVGAPPAMNFGNVRLLNVTHSASSFVQTDDLESFVRAQKGLRSRATDWVDISRGLGEEEADRELNATRALATHEMVVRAQYKAWLGYMREAA